MAYPGLYRAKAATISGTTLTAYIPQVFGDLAVPVTDYVGSLPTATQMGWVAFHGGVADKPIWIGTPTAAPTSGSGTGGLTQAQADLLYVNITGDSMTGSLNVAGDVSVTGQVSIAATPPSAAAHAARKDYVDTQRNSRVPLTRTIDTAAPLTGGGPLSDDLSLAINSFSGSVPGAVPTSPGTTTTFLRADGQWATPPGAGGGIAGITVLEAGSTLDSDITVLDFLAGFDLTESPENEINISLDLSEYSGAALPQAYVANLDTALAAKADSAAMTTALNGKQPLDTDLTTIAGLTATTNNVIQSVGSAWASVTPTALKGTLGLTKTDVGLANVDNTSDANKPVSSATTTALNAKVDKTYTLFTTAPLTIAGTTSADFSASRTLDVSTFTTTTRGVVPSPAGATNLFLRSDVTWQNPYSQTTTDVVFRSGTFVSGGTSSTLGQQIALTHAGTLNYPNTISSSHNSGADALNQIVFKVWKPGDPVTGPPSGTLLTLESTLITAAKPVALPSGDPAQPLYAAHKGYVDQQDALRQPIDADLTDLSVRWTTASAAGPASLAFREDTDFGTNQAVVIATASMLADRIITLPDATTTLVGTDATQTLTNKSIAFGANTVTGTLAQFNIAVTDANLVPEVRTFTATLPLTIAGTTSADLSTDRTLAVNTFTPTTTGVVPAPSGGASNYLRGDVTWVNPHNQITIDTFFKTGQFVSGGSGGAPTKQISFSFGGASNNFRHDILTTHNSGAIASNSIVFSLWQPVDTTAGAPTNTVLTLEGTLITGTKPVVSQAADPEFRLFETDQPAENKVWRVISQAGVLNFIATLDNLTAVATISMSRAGLLTAPNFSGNGSLLTNLNATNITTGTLANARLNPVIDSSTTGSAAKLTVARLISLTGDVTGSINFDGSADVSLPTTIAVNSVALGTDTTGSYIATIAGTTNQVNVTANNVETAAVTLSTPQNIHSAATPTFARMTLSQTTGASPLLITSTTVNTNFNADLLDGEHGTAFHDLQNSTGILPSARISGQYTGITRTGTLDQLIVSGPTQLTSPMAWNSTTGTFDNTIWHRGNHGAGSGLDADKLDGKDSIEFADTEMMESLLGDLLYVGLYNAAAYDKTNDTTKAATKPHPVWAEGPNVYRHSMYWVVGSNGIDINFLDTDYSGRYDEALVFTVTNKGLNSNVVTLTTATPHDITVDKKILIEGVDPAFDGRYVAQAPITATTFSYTKTGANVATTAATGTVTSYVDEQINVYYGDWIIALDPVVGSPGHELGTDLALDQVTFQYIPFSAESYVNARIGAHMADSNDPHSAAGYLTRTTADPVYAPVIHYHTADIQAQIDIHKQEADPHPDYQTETESDLRYSLLDHTHKGVYEDFGAVFDHEQAPDPHPAYVLHTEGDVTYSFAGHLHEGVYSPVGHTHDWMTNKEIQTTDSAPSSLLYVGDNPPSNPVAGDLWLETITIGAQPPPAPAAVTMSPSPTQVIIEWEFPVGTTTDTAQIDWSLDGTSWTTLTATATPPYVPYTHSSRPERTKHYYRVRGHNGTGWGNYLTTSVFTSNAPPNQPGGLTTSALTSTGVTLTWTTPTGATTNDPLSSPNRYEVFLNGVSKGLVTALSYSFTGLVENVVYTLGVRIKDAAGPNDDATFVPLWSTLATVNVTTPNSPPPVPTLPGTPTSKTHDTITLTWNAVSASDFKEYVVTRTGSPAFISDTTTTTSYTFTGLNANTDYTVSVAARDILNATSATISPPVVHTNVTPPDTTPPAPATALSMKPEVDYGRMTARFTTPAGDVTYYNINTSVNGVLWGATGWVPIGPLTMEAVILIYGTGGQTISAELQLVDTAGNISSQYFTPYTLLSSPTTIYADSTNQWRNTSGGRWGGVGNQNPYFDYSTDPTLNALGAWFYGTQINTKLAGKTVATVINPVEIYMYRQAGGTGTAIRPVYNSHTLTTNPGNVSGVAIPTLSNALTPTTYDLSVNSGKWVGLNSTTLGQALINGTVKGMCVYDTTPAGTTQYGKFPTVAENSSSGALKIHHLG